MKLKEQKKTKNIMYAKFNRIILLVFVLFSVSFLTAQTKTIKGVVKDEVNQPLFGVTVIETGTLNGVTTNFDGEYSISAKEKSSLTFSYLGYKSQTIIVGKEDTVNINLIPDTQNLDEIIVIGYGSVKKGDVTGSVATVDMGKLKKAPVPNFDQALAGRVAGLQVQSAGGEPGSVSTITIRGGNSVNGDNSPFYVVDGFIVDNFNPGLIDPSDMESISVLKDASATAIYGVRGANGVIIITTKRAKSGKTKISYESRIDVKTVSKKLEVLGAYDFLDLSFEINPGNTTSRYFSVFDENLGTNVVVGDLEDYRNDIGRNWQDEAFRTAFSQTHKVNISGGTDKTKFNSSINILEDKGSLLNSNYNRTNGRLTIDHKVNDKLKATIDVMYTNYVQNGINTQGDSSYSFLRNLIGYNPIANKFIDYEDGFDPLNDVNDNLDFINIVSWHPIVSLNNEYRRSETDQLVTNLRLNYRITPNLTFDTRGSYNRQFRETGVFNNSKTVYGRLINKINGINGSLDNRTWKYFSNINTLNYKKRIGNHSFDALLGATVNIRQTSRQLVRSIEIPEFLEDLGINSLDGGILNSANDLYENQETRIFSILSRFNYSFKNKYLLTLSLRRDASSNFSKDNRADYFPSAAISWQAHKEDFIKNIDFLSQLKFKLGYGVTGNDRIPATARFIFLTDANSSYFFGDDLTTPGQRPTSFGGNPDLVWETTSQSNFGVDLGLFNDRISFTAEAYQKNTKDLLINSDAALSQGFSTIWINSGEVRNRGLEFSLSTLNVNTKDFKWRSDFNISFNENTVISLPDGKSIFGRPNYYSLLSTNQFIVEEGKPLGNMYGYISDGVYQINDFQNYDASSSVHTLNAGEPSYKSHQPGDEKYKDLNGDGVITAADKTIIGNGLAKHFGGFNNTFTYKNFELSAFLQWSYGNDILNANRLVFENVDIAGQNQLATVLDRWTTENQDTNMHRAGGQGFNDISSRILEDGSYLRLKTVNFSYNFDKEITKKLNLQSLKMFFSAQNLITWTNYSGFDPEVSTSNSAITPGIDYSAYPRHRIVSLGINLTF